MCTSQEAVFVTFRLEWIHVESLQLRVWLRLVKLYSFGFLELLEKSSRDPCRMNHSHCQTKCFSLCANLLMDYKICHVYSAEILYESFSGIYTRRLFIDWKQIISSFNTSTGLTSKCTFSLWSQRWDFLVKVLAHLRQMGAPVLHVCADWGMSFDSISSCRWTMGSPLYASPYVSNSLLYWTVSHSENGLLCLVQN